MTSFKRDGTGVAMPLWFVFDGSGLLALTDLHSASPPSRSPSRSDVSSGRSKLRA